ncbi:MULTISPECIES: glycosyltransferase family 2 protein [unclassified Nodularia (in: cyanobacteria)]|uniref:glycosyltransferase family 2 protein n=1 Tax=unclassified Nodularia (in: cyanobacteria) TaxID=2656917 RepID=UPI00187F0B03|nr:MULTISPECIES: glycosyltransferase family 2 protein [unclassified Nodularia (in: cyanobacteria)]MBE9200176.1 glycosyltransferase family 2 protein [Nodularia sp. LEGE 06071]MCC2694736.1 glycosyltransferase family 2 protein [Nodularia sp. LEGE 04288]
MAPLVSFILPCFNRAIYLEKCVQSILNQTFSDLECLIIDDGSTDNTRQIADKLISKDARVKYFYKENGGVSSARNFGINQAAGDWIQCLDPDDWIHEDKTRFQLSHVNNSNQTEVIFYCDYERVHLDHEQNIIKRELNIVSSLTQEQLIQRLLIPDFLADSPFPVLQQCLLMHKSVFAHKKFDESLKALEDRDFIIDLLVAEVNLVYTPMVGTFYTKHQSNTTNNWYYMKTHYTRLYETVSSKHINLLPLCQIAIDYLIKEAIKEKDQNNFDRLLKMAKPPVYLLDHKIKINHLNLIKFMYIARLFIPNFILYEKYRGPRSRKIIAMFSHLINLAPKSQNL